MQTINGKITISQAARHLGVSRQRVHAIILKNSLETEMVHPRLTLIDPKELEKVRPSKPGKKSPKES